MRHREPTVLLLALMRDPLLLLMDVKWRDGDEMVSVLDRSIGLSIGNDDGGSNLSR